MKVLITAATPAEIQPVTVWLGKEKFRVNEHTVEVLITGPGAIATTYHLTKTCGINKPDYILQAGIAGSFVSNYPIGSVLGVSEDFLGDMGAEENNGFKDLFDLGLIKENDPPFRIRGLQNPYAASEGNFGLEMVKSITINEITTRKQRIESLVTRFSPAIESMEGAAFHYVCLREEIRFLQIRAVSNYVGERNKENWNIKLATENLNKKLIEVLEMI